MKIGATALRKRSTRPYEQIVIEGVTPSSDHGRFPVKALSGETMSVEATVLRHGVDPLCVAARVRRPGSTAVREFPMAPLTGDPDRFRAEFLLDAPGRFTCTIAAWRDAQRLDEVRNESDLEIMADRPIAGAGSWVSLACGAGLSPLESRLGSLHDQGFNVVHVAADPPDAATAEAFDRFAHSANALGFEVAVDLEGARTRHLDFDKPTWKRLWPEFRDVVRFWISHGIKIFRVEAPHLRPLGFWSWLIEETHLEAPEVVFLAGETPRLSFGRALGARGFTQSVVSVGSVLEVRSFGTRMRSNVWVQGGDTKATLLLAATLSPSWTVTDPPGHLAPWLTNLNALRRSNPCLLQSGGCRFIETDDDQLVAFVRFTPDRSNAIIVVVNLDPSSPRSSIVRVPAADVGMNSGKGFEVVDALTGRAFAWSEAAHVRIDPGDGEPAHVFTIKGR